MVSSIVNDSIWPFDVILTDSDLGVMAMKGCIPQISRVGVLPTDGLVPYPENSLGNSYSSAEIVSIFYNPSQLSCYRRTVLALFNPNLKG